MRKRLCCPSHGSLSCGSLRSPRLNSVSPRFSTRSQRSTAYLHSIHIVGLPGPACLLSPSGPAPPRPCVRVLAGERLESVPPHLLRAPVIHRPGRPMRGMARIHLALHIPGKIDKYVAHAHHEPRVITWMPKMLQSPPIDITHALSRTLRRSNLLLCLSHKFLHN